MRRVVMIVLVVMLALIAGACGATRQTAPSSATTGSVARVTKLLVVVEENHSLNQMRVGMPYTFGLAKRYGYATDYHAVGHPSLRNYLAITSGKMWGVHDDKSPSAHPIRHLSVFGEARRHNKSAKTYAESMPVRCHLRNHGQYVVRHSPWAYFVNNRAGCRVADRTMRAFAPDVRDGQLPRVGMVVPNVAHDAHDGSLAAADRWFRSLMTKVFAGRDWKSGHLAVVLTADEDDHNQGNKVLTTVIHPSQHHDVVTKRLNHYSLTRLYDEVAGLPHLHNAKTAPSMANAFGLPIG